MSDFTEGKAARTVVNGLLVEKAAFSKAGASVKDVFKVVGGRVLLKTLLFEVTTVFAAGANNTDVVHTPTGGAAKALCEVLDTVNDAVGTYYSITGLPATAMTEGIGSVEGQLYEVTLGAGTLGFRTAGNTTGAVKASMIYVPLDDGAYVEAA